jgi:DNA-binding NarL/FixJ family response regulator
MAFSEALNGKDALHQIDSFEPDLIFLDINLPDSNGLEITKYLRKYNCKAKIIILTSCNLPEYRDAAIQNGADYFLSKGSTTAKEITTLVDSVTSDHGSKQGDSSHYWGQGKDTFIHLRRSNPANG